MAAGSDVRDILELEQAPEKEMVTKESLMNDGKKKKPKKSELTFKRPEGMHRELWGLLWTDNKDAPPIIPSDTNQGYKQMKAKIGSSRVRPWKWMPFTNPARKDGAIFYHYRRVADEGRDYPFARFNKSVDVPTYSDLEYQQHLHDDNWPRQETDHLFDLCKRFDLRFIIIHDRWDREKYRDRSVEDLKERYYNVCNTLSKVRAPQGSEPKIKAFDAEHERKRKLQLIKLFDRTPEQVEEEDYLIAELKKIELRKKEREKKTQDLQKLITAADSSIDSRRTERKTTKKKVNPQQKIKEIGTTPDSGGIKFADFKQSGVSLRSQRMKLPASIGQKKLKAIEQVLEELGIEYNPMPTEDIVHHFNELRQDIVLLYELKLALANCEYELQTLRHRMEPDGSAQPLEIDPLGTPIGGMVIKTEPPSLPPSAPSTPAPDPGSASTSITPPSAGAIFDPQSAESPNKQKKLLETIDVVGVGAPGTPNRKRKAALEQSNILKKIKQKP
ncbi:DNA methyltransferase 1-associated protein 1-like isoform X2 [Haliotis rubra]|uniref:DNA methyltransferase 1-associated protein 1-like isoform X2 n=1 Tax=Haliotis rubra TaxID=36100 RepID=UPI001EE5C90C|nr:DNA methyltransferase 1-associated protein 1-like isoform X2 [Haliotis rubra]XP_046578142.1 DNA methyltransferase 1-associated protein 1-like isoform X2 [Haliotis rubra]